MLEIGKRVYTNFTNLHGTGLNLAAGELQAGIGERCAPGYFLD